MDFLAIIGTIAALVSIVGGVLGIISSLSKEPVFTRLWQRQQRIKSQPALQPSPSFSPPIGRVVPSKRAEDEFRQILPPSRLKPGIVYGLVSGVFAILIAASIEALSLQTTLPSYFGYISYIGLVVLSIAAGILSSRASGSLLSALIAAVILGICCWLAPFSVYFFYAGYYDYPVNELQHFIVVRGVPSFIVCMLFGLLGRHLYKRLQVPAPNEYAIATIKLPSGIGAQQLQPPHSARQVPVQGKCPNCGASNQPGSQFCNQCGTKL